MNPLYPFCQMAKKHFALNMQHATITVALLLISLFSFSQEYVFRNPSLDSGSAGNDGAVYRFPNVAANVDALVKINGRSSTLVTLDTVDVTSTGYDKAFQPLVTYKGGTVKGPASWWMEFVVTFVQTGTKTPITLDTINATALDIDGDGSKLQEQFSAFGTATYTLNTPTSLTVSSITGGKLFTGPIANSTGIDTTAANVRVTLNYVNTSSIRFRYGGQVTSSSSTTAANRYNSIWFKAFQYTAAKIVSLPVYLLSFNAALENSNSVMLNWATSSERNASHFVIQRSIDGDNFDDEAIVFTEQGNSSSVRNYNYADNIISVNSSLIYYRLKMVDIDGNFNYSEVEVIRLGKQQQQNLVTFPNPASSEVRVTIPSDWQNKTVAYSIYNLNGSLVKQKVNSNAGQTESFYIADLPAGLYVIKAATGNETATQKFIKKL
jgi:type IX secretion system substrate protein